MRYWRERAEGTEGVGVVLVWLTGEAAGNSVLEEVGEEVGEGQSSAEVDAAASKEVADWHAARWDQVVDEEVEEGVAVEGWHCFGNAMHDGSVWEVGNREERVTPR